MQKQNQTKIEFIDNLIKNLIKEYVSKNKLNLAKGSFCLNVELVDEGNISQEVTQSLEAININDSNIIITLQIPYNYEDIIVELDSVANKLIIKNKDLSFYKEFWLSSKVKADFSISFNNNILEACFDIEKE
ncbi:MAG: hypothetical protein V1824_04770 [archaeon]